jgi:hypothetical protein
MEPDIKEAVEVSERIAKSDLSIEEKMRLHLFGNLSVPVSDNMLPVCIEVIERANSGEDRDTLVDLPDLVWFNGEVQATIQQIIDGHRLEFFLDDYEVQGG